MNKKERPRKRYVTCRMEEETYQRFKQYCEQYHLSLPDALNDFAIALMAQDFGQKVYEKMQALKEKPDGRQALHRRIEHEVATIPVDGPLHCTCGQLLGDPDEWVIHAGRIYHNWRCALRHFEQLRLEEWKNE
jgi:hypothetical protein